MFLPTKEDSFHQLLYKYLHICRIAELPLSPLNGQLYYLIFITYFPGLFSVYLVSVLRFSNTFSSACSDLQNFKEPRMQGGLVCI